MEKEMATHSSTLAWRTRWTEEPDGPQSMGSEPGTAEPLTHTGRINGKALCITLGTIVDVLHNHDGKEYLKDYVCVTESFC